MQVRKYFLQYSFVATHPQAFFVYGLTSTGFKTGYFPPVANRRLGPAATLRMPTVGAVMMATVGAARGILAVTKSERNLLDDLISIGRAPTCDMVLPDRGVSKLHAHFCRDAGGRWNVRDADSTNGTFVDGKRAAPGLKVPLAWGTSLRMAHCEGRFLDAERLFDMLNGVRVD